MAFVPELDDDTKKEQDPNAAEIGNQVAAPAAAPQIGGNAVGGNPAASSSKSSGNFQDFSKFKAANQNKLSALSNLAQNQATGSLDKAKTAFQNSGSQIQGELANKAKNFDTSGYKALNADSTFDADKIGKDLSEAGSAVDVTDTITGLTAGQEYTNLSNAEKAASNLASRAGTSDVLNQYGAENGKYSAAASNQDALLLQSMNDYRAKANQIAGQVKGTTNDAYNGVATNIQGAAKTVQDNNLEYKRKAIEALKGAKGQIDQKLVSDAAAEQAKREAQTGSVESRLNDALRARARKEAEIMNAPTVGEFHSQGPGSLGQEVDGYYKIKGVGGTQDIILNGDKAKDKYAEDLRNYSKYLADQRAVANQSIEGLTDKYGNSALLNANREGNKYTADDVFANDKNRQAQIDALSRLLGPENIGQTYNAGKVASQNQNKAVEDLIAQITKEAGGAGKTLHQNINTYDVPDWMKQDGISDEVKKLKIANPTLPGLPQSSSGGMAGGGSSSKSKAKIANNQY